MSNYRALLAAYFSCSATVQKLFYLYPNAILEHKFGEMAFLFIKTEGLLYLELLSIYGILA